MASADISTPFRLPNFYPIVDTSALASCGLSALEVSQALIEARSTILQYRHKEAWRQSHFDEAAAIARLCEEAGVLFVLNDRADYARLLNSALHIGQDDLPPTAARKIVKDEVIGYSTHNAGQLRLADRHPFEYLSIGPIFSTSSKLKPDPVVGVDGLRQLRSLTEKPLCAIGGLTLANAPDVLKAGADSVAIISGLLPSPKPSARQVRDHAVIWLETLARL